MAIILEREDGSDASHRHRLSFQIDRPIENLNSRNQPPTIARNETERIAERGIVLIVPREKLAAIVIPMPKQLEHLVPLATMRRSNFHNLVL